MNKPALALSILLACSCLGCGESSGARDDSPDAGDPGSAMDAAVGPDGSSLHPGDDAGGPDDASSPVDAFVIDPKDPWSGQCSEGSSGTFQMRPDCTESEEAAIQAAGVGPAKAYTFDIDSYKLRTPMQPGKPFTFSMTVTGFGQPAHLELWGADSQCGSQNIEKLASLLTPGGIVCATMTPKAAHTHLLLVLRANNGLGSDVHRECPDGQCVVNTGVSQAWPGADQPFCDPNELEQCEVCEHDEACSSPAYTDNGDGTVSSSCCGLTWQKADDSPVLSWKDAAAYCTNLTLDGGGFRLPTFAELHSLVKPGASPTIDTSHFPDANGLGHWSSTARPGSQDAWVVHFSDGRADDDGTTSKYRVRCVR